MTKQWQLNQYMYLLVKQDVLYFFAYVRVSFFPSVFSLAILPRKQTELTLTFRDSVFLFALVDILGTSGKLPTEGWQLLLLFILQSVPIYTLTPRFILSIRELYARDVQGRRSEGIDTEFGLSLSGRGAASGTAIVFVDVEQNEMLDGVEEIPMEVGTSWPE